MTSHEDSTQKRIRLLRPSWFLRLAVACALLVLSLIVGLICRELGLALIVSYLVGFSPMLLVEPISQALTQRAEYRQSKFGLWYQIDIEREKQRYGPLKANRVFGHPLGKSRSP